MRKQLLFVVFVSAFLSAQTASQANSSISQNPTASTTSAEVPPDAPVLTLQGLCPDRAAGTDPNAPDCRTVVTRAEFEHLVHTLSPNMPPSAKQTLANDYGRMLVIANEARKRGLENTQHYKDLLNFVKMQLLAQELMRSLQEQAKPSPAEVERYYNDNSGRYEVIAVKRLFIPRNRPEPTPADGKTPPAVPKPVTDAELLAQGEKLRAELVAGGDFEKLQKEVYESAGFKTAPPPTSIPNWPHDAVPASEQQLFQLKPKEFSKVMIEPSGAYIYQLEELKRTPLEQIKPQIESTITNERLRAMMEKITSSVKTEPNPAYFGMPGPEGSSQVRPTRPSTGPASPGSPAPK